MDTPNLNRDNLSYRQSTIAVVTDQNNKLLLIQKRIYQDDQWNFPGGGVDTGESPQDAVMRELSEELGSKEFVIKAVSKNKNKYEWPDEIILDRLNRSGEMYRGQEVTQFWVTYSGTHDQIHLEHEMKALTWVELEELQKYLVFPNQWENAKSLLTEFNLLSV